MIDLTTISVLVTSASVITGVVMASLQVRTMAKTRQAQLFMEVYRSFLEEDFREKQNQILLHEWKGYEDWFSRYGPEANPKAFQFTNKLMTFYEGLGVLVKRKMIDIGLVDDLIGQSVRDIYEKLGPLIKTLRERTNKHLAYEWVEYLYNQVKEYERKRGVVLS